MPGFKTLALFVALSASALCAQTTLSADSAHFTINQGAHPVGRTEFNLQAIQQGRITTPAAYSVGSHGTLSIQNTKYSFSSTGTLDKDLGILSEDLNGVVNGSAVTFAVHTTGQSFSIDISANGQAYHNSLTRPAQAVFFPDFDMASYEVLLNLVALHPGTPVSALIPKQNGILSSATLAPQGDVQAKLNTAALTVHHASLTIGTVVSELYYSPGNRILEVDIPSQTFAVVHDNFQLEQPPPPPNSAPSGSQQ